MRFAVVFLALFSSGCATGPWARDIQFVCWSDCGGGVWYSDPNKSTTFSGNNAPEYAKKSVEKPSKVSGRSGLLGSDLNLQ